MNYFLPFLGALVFSLALTGFAKSIGEKFGFVSTPRARDVHKKPVPRIGGVAIFLSYILVSLFLYLFVYEKTLLSSDFTHHLIGIWLGGLLISGTMLLDDIIGLRAYKKLGIQIAVALVVIASGIGIDSLSNPFGPTLNLNSVYIPLFTYGGIVYHFSLWSDLLTMVWLVGMMNVINFVDGVDGLAGGISAIAALTIFQLSLLIGQPNTAMVAVILAGSVLGFLVWNFPPAKIFMGDCGSMFLGFMLGVLPLISGGKLATVFLVLGFPIVDGILVAVGRIARGKNPLTTPDKTHLHHRLLGAGFSQRQAILLIYILAIAFGWVALRASSLGKIVASLILCALIAIFILTLTYLRTRKIKEKLV